MGILYSNAELMIKAKQNGVSFNSIITLGHLKLFVKTSDLKQLAKKYHLNIDIDLLEENIYADVFFKLFLDAKNVQTLDYSDYEKCDILHDMNTNIDDKYLETIDVVIDGGTLEHVFNFPVAIKSCMQMLKKNGSLFVFTMANNHMGHGFYQFSPELFFRVCSEENGFEVVDLLLEEHKYPGAELNQNSNIYKVTDPLDINGRVGLVSNSPVMMMVHALRTEIKPIFSKYPIQSDYISTYERHQSKETQQASSSIKTILKKLFYKLPQCMKNLLEGKRQLVKYSFKNRLFYKRQD